MDIPLSTVIPGGGTRSTFLDARDRLAPVMAPVEGVVVCRGVHLGDTVAAGQVLFTIVDTRNLWVVATRIVAGGPSGTSTGPRRCTPRGLAPSPPLIVPVRRARPLCANFPGPGGLSVCITA